MILKASNLTDQPACLEKKSLLLPQKTIYLL